MLKNISCLILGFIIAISASSQNVDLHYYLPDIAYDPAIPTPEAFLDYQVGEWHATHDQLRYYMQTLAELSDRVVIEEYARSYENRPLLLLTITSPENHVRLDDILVQRQAICNPSQSGDLNLATMPTVIYQGYSIHGNEASGSNAALLVAYYLAAGQSEQLEALLDNVVILLDPCFNPDGLQRFSTWVNSHKNAQMTADPSDREYNEAWPRGRTNHYWFDLNRDWLLLQHPESQGRIANFHKWKPNILTDHHEMGTNSTFFFMPGIPSRVNPLTPQANQDLTADIATYHAAALDEIGSLYYTEESYDDFYYGKGSTYPDANGCIGILFEQASARGHMQESANGILTFPFAIRNQVMTSLSTQEAAMGLREELLEFQRAFYHLAETDAASDPVKAYQFELPGVQDYTRLYEFVNLLLQHQIEVYYQSIPDDLDPNAARFIVPLDQPQYRMVKAIFGTQTSFEDSLFYDVSAWTLPYAYNLEYEEVRSGSFSPSMLASKVPAPFEREPQVVRQSDYGYALPWAEYYAPGAAYALLEKGLRVKVAQHPFTIDVGDDLPVNFSRGTLLLPVQNQDLNSDQIYDLLPDIANEFGVRFWDLPSGKTISGPDLGSRTFRTIDEPRVLLVVGEGASGYESGELWHLFDQRYQIPVVKVEAGDLARTDLHRYSTILMADGNYRTVSATGTSNLREWVQSGGILVLTRDAIDWAADKHFVQAKRIRHSNADSPGQRPYAKSGADRGSNRLGGAIFQIDLDLTHPLVFGYEQTTLPVFRRGTSFFQVTDNPYATPGRYTRDPLLSGYISDENLELLRESASIWVGGLGDGRVICFADNPSFRAYWWGTQKLIANAVFFGSTISEATVERPPAAKTDSE